MGVNNLVRKWIESRERKPESEYDAAKREFEMAIGQPFITLKLEIPIGFEEFSSDFRKLENDHRFHEEVQDLIKKRLLLDSRRKKNSQLE